MKLTVTARARPSSTVAAQNVESFKAWLALKQLTPEADEATATNVFSLGDGILVLVKEQRQVANAMPSSMISVLTTENKELYRVDVPGLSTTNTSALIVAHSGKSFHWTNVIMSTTRDGPSTRYVNSIFVDMVPGKAPFVQHFKAPYKDTDTAEFNGVTATSACGRMLLLTQGLLMNSNSSVARIRVIQIPVSDDRSEALVDYDLEANTVSRFNPRKSGITASFQPIGSDGRKSCVVDIDGNVMLLTTQEYTQDKAHDNRADARIIFYPVSGETAHDVFVYDWESNGDTSIYSIHGGPGGQLVIRLSETVAMGRRNEATRELIPTTAEDNYTHFFQGDKIAGELARDRRGFMAASAASTATPME